MNDNVNKNLIISPFYKRFLSFTIDVSLHYANMFFWCRLIIRLDWDVFIIISFFVMTLYFVFFYIGTKGQTFGYRCFGLKIEYYGKPKLKPLFIIVRSGLLSSIANPLFLPIIPASFLFFSLVLLSVKYIRERKQLVWDVGGHFIVVEGAPKYTGIFNLTSPKSR